MTKQVTGTILLISLWGCLPSLPPPKESQSCPTVSFPSSFTEGCIDTNRDGRCSAAGDIWLAPNGYFSQLEGERPSQEGRWFRQGDKIFLLLKSPCALKNPQTNCKGCAAMTHQSWYLSYQEGFWLTKDDTTVPVGCLLPE